MFSQRSTSIVKRVDGTESDSTWSYCRQTSEWQCLSFRPTKGGIPRDTANGSLARTKTRGQIRMISASQVKQAKEIHRRTEEKSYREHRPRTPSTPTAPVNHGRTFSG